MPFKKLLSDLLQTAPGALGAILADWEGESVDQVALIDDYELKVIGAHKGVILHRLRGALRRLDGDDLREVIITTGKTRTVVLPVTSEYFLVLVLRRENALGRAIFAAHNCVMRLREEIG